MTPLPAEDDSLPESLRDPVKVRERGEYLLALEKAGCHRLGWNAGCWRVRCHLGTDCIYREAALFALGKVV